MTVTIHQGDALAVLRTLPADSVHCVVTSPPYFGLRDYGVAGQLGLEPTPAEFIAALVAVFNEVRRVLRPDGVCFVNLGDSYAGSGKGPTGANGIGNQGKRQGFDDDHSYRGIPAKNLLLIPERFAIAMQEAGWWVRSRIAWCKTASMPESVRDRPTSAWEHLWMFTKAPRYYWDQEAVRTPGEIRNGNAGTFARQDSARAAALVPGQGYGTHRADRDDRVPAGANLRNYWLLGPEPLRSEHYAAYPSELVRRCVLAATSAQGACPTCGTPWVRVVESTRIKAATPSGWREQSKRWDQTTDTAAVGGRVLTSTLGWQQGCTCPPATPVPCVVLDPFLGSGTTALVADRLGRDAIGIELSPDYVAIEQRRLEVDAGFLADTRVVPPPVLDVQPDIFDAGVTA